MFQFWKHIIVKMKEHTVAFHSNFFVFCFGGTLDSGVLISKGISAPHPCPRDLEGLRSLGHFRADLVVRSPPVSLEALEL
jgi:hypothetical protein